MVQQEVVLQMTDSELDALSIEQQQQVQQLLTDKLGLEVASHLNEHLSSSLLADLPSFKAHWQRTLSDAQAGARITRLLDPFSKAVSIWFNGGLFSLESSK